jgi:hypothetical protein
MGRATSVSKTITGDTARTTQYDYDLSGKTVSTTYPDTYNVAYIYYSGTGLLNKVTGTTDSKEYANITGYEPTGKIGTIAHANGTETVYSYDAPSTRLTNIVSKDSTQAVIQDRGYFYTKAGDIDLIADSLKGITYTYNYDDLHRLKTETNTGAHTMPSATPTML